MKRTILFILTALVLSSCKESKIDVTKYVDPFICTQGDHGHWHPSALSPFGLIKLGADTYPGSLTADGDFAHGGYDFSDSQIRGFSHMRQGSSGGGAKCDRAGLVSILPFTKEHDDEWYHSPIVNIDKSRERASVGYYTTYLKDERVTAELAALPHTGFHRYQFESGALAKLLINKGNTRFGHFEITQEDANIITGELQGYFHFVIECSQDISSLVKYEDTENYICSFDSPSGDPLELKVGISLTGLSDAKNNLKAEKTDFDSARETTASRWEEVLSRILVASSAMTSPEDDLERKRTFYTSIYHSCFYPVTHTNCDGSYLDMNKEKSEGKGYTHYDSYAFWDSFHSKYALFSLMAPEIYTDITTSLFELYKHTRFDLSYPNPEHKVHNAAMYTIRGNNGGLWGTCRHEHMAMVVADAYRKGFMKYDLAEVYPYMKEEVLTQMGKEYDEIGYIPSRPDQSGEYSWDNYTVAQMAKELGNSEDYDYFMKRSEYWKNSWDDSLKFFRAKGRDGQWLDFTHDPKFNREKYTYEGTKWQIRWNVLHDVDGLIEAIGGREAFVKELTYFYENDLYTAGNQIDLHAPFLFNRAGEPWMTQKWVYELLTKPTTNLYGTHSFYKEPIVDKIYKDTPDGYLEEMDDDYGCMAAWYSMSAMGLFQIYPSDPTYEILTPIFSDISIALPDGKSFTIEAEGLSDTNFYIQSATLNGKEYEKCQIDYSDIAEGGSLKLVMGSTPNKKWGVK